MEKNEENVAYIEMREIEKGKAFDANIRGLCTKKEYEIQTKRPLQISLTEETKE